MLKEGGKKIFGGVGSIASIGNQRIVNCELMGIHTAVKGLLSPFGDHGMERTVQKSNSGVFEVDQMINGIIDPLKAVCPDVGNTWILTDKIVEQDRGNIGICKL